MVQRIVLYLGLFLVSSISNQIGSGKLGSWLMPLLDGNGFWSTSAWAAEPLLIGTIKKFSGKVSLVRGKKMIPALTGLKVFEGDQVRTGPKSSAEIFGNKKLIAVGENSDLVLNTEAPSKEAFPTEASGEVISVKLNKGKLRAIVGGAKTDYYKMKIYTRTAVAGVRGTQADIVSEGEGAEAKTSVITTEGQQSLDFYSGTGAGNYQKTTVTEGTYIGSNASGVSSGSRPLDENQWANLRQRDLDNNPMDVRLTNSGEIASTTLVSEVVGLTAAQTEPLPAPVSQSPGVVVPPISMVYDPVEKKFIPAGDLDRANVYKEDAPTQTAVVVSPSGEAVPVVDVPPTPGDLARANLLLNRDALIAANKARELEKQIAQELANSNYDKAKITELESSIAAQKRALFEFERTELNEQIQDYAKRIENAKGLPTFEGYVKSLQADLELAKAEKEQVETKIEIIQSSPNNVGNSPGHTEASNPTGGSRSGEPSASERNSGPNVGELEKKLAEITSKLEEKRSMQALEKMNPNNKINAGRREFVVDMVKEASEKLAATPTEGELTVNADTRAPTEIPLTLAVKMANGTVAYLDRTAFEDAAKGTGDRIFFPPVFTLQQMQEKSSEMTSPQSIQTRQLASGTGNQTPATSPGANTAITDEMAARMKAYCQSNPSSPSCLKSGEVSQETEKKSAEFLQQAVASGCAANPTLPGCETRAFASNPLLNATADPNRLNQNQCILNPSMPECQSGVNNPCFINPSLTQCGLNTSVNNYTSRPVIINLSR